VFKKNLIKTALSLGLLTMGLAVQAANVSFSDSYVGSGGNSSSCSGSTYKITGKEPSTAGKNPVFIYTVGTLENDSNGQGLALIDMMAAKGYVAAMVGYSSGLFGSSSYISNKARCIYDATSTKSAIAKICARSKADCSKGIVTAGFSQGSVIATVAANFDSRVRAAYALGLQDNYASFQNTASLPANRKLPKNRLRVANGIGDNFNGGSAATARESAADVTGYTCSGNNCLQPDGSGWMLVEHSDVTDGSADHCYMRASGDLCLGSQKNNDAKWLTGPAPWAAPANLNWLDGFVSH